jgi:limonene-1,2-epoxide hydrolase
MHPWQAMERGLESIPAYGDGAAYGEGAALRQFLEGLLGGMASAVHFEIRTQLVDGLTVMNERVDTIVMADRKVELPVCGVFELAPDGRIKAWRDYFDVAQFSGAAPAEG